MKLTHVIWVVAALAGVSQLASRTTAQGQDVKAAYDRAESLTRRVGGLALNVPENPNWIENSPKVWYRKSVKGGNEFVMVDAAAKTKAPAFDHAKLAAAIGTAANQKYTAVELPFTTFTFVDNQRAIEFTLAPVGTGRAGGGGGGGRTSGRRRTRPAAGALSLLDHRLHLRAGDRDAGGRRCRPAGWSGPRRWRRGRPRRRRGSTGSARSRVARSEARSADPELQHLRSAGRSDARRFHAEHGRVGRERLHVQLAPLVAGLEEVDRVQTAARATSGSSTMSSRRRRTNSSRSTRPTSTGSPVTSSTSTIRSSSTSRRNSR